MTHSGFQVLRRRRVVDAEWVKRYATIPVANISDCMNRLTGFGPRLRPYHSAGNLCGPALTVRSRPGDNLMAHAALTLLTPGDVLIVDCGGDLTNSIVGERMMITAQRRGCAGFVINGAVRDLDWIKRNDFPVYGAGVHHRGPYKTGPGEINVPIAIDGQVIEPGDLIVGDDDGLLCIPFDEVETLYPLAQAKQESETSTMGQLGLEPQADARAKAFAELRKMGCFIEE